jgi:hypothetical protein
MSISTEPNEPAFPVRGTNYYGMSLRDWFAGQALAGALVRFDAGEAARVAEVCYKFADEMMKAKNQ